MARDTHLSVRGAIADIVNALQVLDAAGSCFRRLPKEAQDLIDASPLSAAGMDEQTIRKLSLDLDAILDRQPVGTFVHASTVTDRVLDECLNKMLARRKRQAAE